VFFFLVLVGVKEAVSWLKEMDGVFLIELEPPELPELLEWLELLLPPPSDFLIVLEPLEPLLPLEPLELLLPLSDFLLVLELLELLELLLLLDSTFMWGTREKIRGRTTH